MLFSHGAICVNFTDTSITHRDRKLKAAASERNRRPTIRIVRLVQRVGTPR